MNNEQTTKAIVEKRKKSSITWLIPLVALIATSWLIYKTISEAGVNIVVNFKSGNGFKAGKTMVFYKGYSIGKITNITVGNDLKSVNAHITVNKQAAEVITREGTDFWIVKPKFSVSEISGLDTIISGVYIEVRPPSIDIEKIKKLQRKYHFNGHDEKPLKYHKEDGLNLTLIAKNLSGISIGTPIFYKKFKIGEVIATELLEDRVKVFINLQKKYGTLVNSSTVFWNVSGIKVDAGLSGVNVQMDSLTSLISGGITFKTLDMNAPAINGRDEFVLYSDSKHIEDKKTVVRLIFNDAKGLQEDKTPILYKGIQIGKIKSLKLEEDKIIATAFLDKKYKSFNTENTKYHKVDLTIDGIKIKNLDTILSGIHINIIPGKGAFKNEFNVYDTQAEALKKELLNITIRSEKLYNLKIGSKIYYKNILVGTVLDYNFTKDMEDVIIKAGIMKKYSHLVNDKTLFYSISTPVIEAKNFDLKVNFEGIEPLIQGGIGLEYTKSNNKVLQRRFWLHNSYIDLLKIKQQYTDGKRLQIQIDERISLKPDMPIFYRNNKIGFIEGFDHSGNKPIAILFIDNQYKNIIKEHSKFYKQSAIEVKADISNVNFKMGSIETLLKGGIILTNSFKITDKNIISPLKYKLYSDFESLPIEKHEFDLVFSNIEGLNLTDVKLVYKGMPVGKITDIKLNKNLNEFNAKAYIYDDFKNVAAKTSVFYTVKPDISLSGVTGLDTIIKGSYVNIMKGEGELGNSFFVYDKKPEKSKLSKGLEITLISNNSGSLSTSSSVYYKKIKVGEIENIDLHSNAKFLVIKLFIYDRYKNLVRQNSEFFNVSGIDMDISLMGGAKIKADSLNTVVFGGVSFVTPNEYKDKANKGTIFNLHSKFKDEWKDYNPEIILE